jgi:hypothetical protein
LQYCATVHFGYLSRRLDRQTGEVEKFRWQWADFQQQLIQQQTH